MSERDYFTIMKAIPLLFLVASGLATAIPAATFTVTTTSDTGPGSLRQAILDANASPGQDTVGFEIPGTSVNVITLSSPLPTVTDPLLIDGTTQPGYAGTPLIEINGNNRNNLTVLRLAAGESTVRGLALYGWRVSGIHVVTNGNSVVEGCFIGTDASGTNTPSASGEAIFIDNTSGNRIGGTTPGQRNLIARGGGTARILIAGPGASNNVVAGNFIGTDRAGTTLLGSVDLIISNAPNNLIGGLVPEARNLIGGTSGGRISILGSVASGNKVQGNWIGVKADGGAFFTEPGSGRGVTIDEAPGNLVGGVGPGARNVLSGTQSGVSILGTNATGNVVQGNFIGTDLAGTNKIPNHAGVSIGRGASRNEVGGEANGAGNLISGNRTAGVSVNNASGNLVHGNFIGTDVTGLKALGNGQQGVSLGAVTTGVAENNRIGGTTAGARNVIAGNGEDGISLVGANTRSNLVQGNLIGLGADGTTRLGNGGRGIVSAGAVENLIGGATGAAGNVIAHSSLEGVWLAGLFGASGPIGTNNLMQHCTIYSNGMAGVTLLGPNVISECSIFDNAGLAIDRNGDGPTPNVPGADGNSPTLLSATITGRPAAVRLSHLQNAPATTLRVKGQLNEKPNTKYTVEFFSDPFWIAGLDLRLFFGKLEVTTDATGLATFEHEFAIEGLPISGSCVTATATASETSEPAAPVPVTSGASSPAVIGFQQSIYTVKEGQDASLTLIRSGNVSVPATVHLKLTSGIAEPALDFFEGDGVVTFAAGETQKTFTVRTILDSLAEPKENFYAYLVPPKTGEAVELTVNSTRIEIMENDPSQTPPPHKFNSISMIGNEISVSWEGNGYLQCARTVLGPWVTLPGAGSPFMMEAAEDQKFLRLLDKICDEPPLGPALQGPFIEGTNCLRRGRILGRLLGPDGAAYQSQVVRIGDSSQVAITKPDGSFVFDDVPEGTVPVKIEQEIKLTDPATGVTERFPIDGTIEIDLKGNEQVDLQLKVEIDGLGPVPCECTPWCAIIGGVVNGVQTVAASGGASGFCLDSPEVKITGPGGVESNFPAAPLPKRKRDQFSPAANGTWRVTATICDQTKTCEITLP